MARNATHPREPQVPADMNNTLKLTSIRVSPSKSTPNQTIRLAIAKTVELNSVTQSAPHLMRTLSGCTMELYHCVGSRAAMIHAWRESMNHKDKKGES